MLDWIIIAVSGGLLAAGCATGSILTKLLQRLLFAPKEITVTEAISAQDVEANRENQGEGMEDLLFDEKLKLLMQKENLKKKLLKHKQIIRQLMGGSGDKGQLAASGAAEVAAAVGIGGSGDKGGAEGSTEAKSERAAREDTEADYFAAELELSKWTN